MGQNELMEEALTEFALVEKSSDEANDDLELIDNFDNPNNLDLTDQSLI